MGRGRSWTLAALKVGMDGGPRKNGAGGPEQEDRPLSCPSLPISISISNLCLSLCFSLSISQSSLGPVLTTVMWEALEQVLL